MAFAKSAARAAALAALLVLATAAPGAKMADPFGKPFAADAEVTGKEADYSHFAEMLASVMLLREGGVEKALESVPMLHDETHAYIKTVSLLSKSEFNLTNWKGMSASGVASIAGKSGKNITGGNYAAKNDALKQSGVDLMNKLNATGKLVVDPAVDEKLAPVTASMNALGDKIAGTDEAFIADLNAKLNKYNIAVTGKSVGQPSKFNNAAALVTRFITGVSLSATGVNFAPCLISYSATGVVAGATAVNVAPIGFGFTPNGVTAAAQGVNLQPVLILVQPIGANVQPQGAQIAPFLIAVSPLGVNVQPQGANIAPARVAVAPVGTAIVPQGKVYAPVENAFAPVDINITPKAP
jgi:hypothetical protein